ncbi:DUF4169 family protein [Chelatococcus sp. XZ-Ab1]|uniref:DUF4169 family protein n=1 Tax=Chelatococcus sp. XZ-Ab1 TaxID=3034027 RepID=UPI0023E414A4|nr:DUF4169 family protein [Chelatococcus sp. XZ-Ab1]
MADIVNLRMARKAKSRSRKEAEADANRVRFGRPKAERLKTQREQERLARAHEGHRLTTPDEDA